MSLYSSAVKKPITTALIFVAIAIIGIFSLSNLSIDLYPKIEVKTIMVVTSYPGAGTEDIENNISRPLENSLNSISDVKHIRSVSKDNFSTVILEFEEDVDLEVATNDVRDKLDMVSNALPKEATKPLIFKFSSDDIPVMLISVKAEQSASGLNKIIEDNVRNRIARISGVGSVNVMGAPSREIQVYCDPYKLEAYNMSLQTVSQAILANNSNVPVGSVDLGSRTNAIRVEGELYSSKEIEDIVIGSYKGKHIYVSDVARVEDTVKERMQESYTDGQRGGIIMILKQSGANSVKVCDEIKKILPDVQKNLPSDIDMKIVMDSSTFINNTINSLVNTILITFIVVVFVVLFFLGRWRATFIIVLTIPISLVASFVYLYGTGNTLNIISMSALSIAIGMVVDDAIVVLENITTHIERGSFPKQAAVFATNEVAISVVASTLTMLAVFLPLTLVSGFTGILFRQLGFIVSIVMIVSTVAALTLTPMLSSQMLTRTQRNSPFYDKIFGAIDRWLNKLSRGYGNLLSKALSHRTFVIVAALVIFLGSMALIPLLKTEFFPEGDQGRVTGTLEFAPGTRMEVVREFGHKFFAELNEKYGDVIETSNFNVGISDDDDAMGSVFSGGANTMSINIGLVPYEERTMTSQELAHLIRQDVARYPEVEIYTVNSGGGPGGSTVDMEIYGYNLNTTTDLAKEFADRMMKSGVASEASISRKAEVPEYRVVFDEEKLALHGLTKVTAASELRNAINGSISSYFREDGDEYQIRVRYAPEFREELQSVQDVLIPTPMGTSVRMRDLGELVEVSMPPAIERKDRERYVKIACMPAPGHAMSDIVDESKAIMADIGDVEGVTWELAGSFENQQKSFRDLFTLMILIILLVYIVMAAQFESLSDPFVIMFSVPFGFTGVILGLLLTGTPMGVMALIGAIMLIGIVVKNGIVLIDYIRLCRERGMGVIRSVVEAGKSRLRPVLMTTATTVLGMVPLAIGIGEGSEMWKSMGMTVATGLTFSTIVTLILIPVIYASFTGIELKKTRKKLRRRTRRKKKDIVRKQRREQIAKA